MVRTTSQSVGGGLEIQNTILGHAPEHVDAHSADLARVELDHVQGRKEQPQFLLEQLGRVAQVQSAELDRTYRIDRRFAIDIQNGFAIQLRTSRHG